MSLSLWSALLAPTSKRKLAITACAGIVAAIGPAPPAPANRRRATNARLVSVVPRSLGTSIAWRDPGSGPTVLLGGGASSRELARWNGEEPTARRRSAPRGTTEPPGGGPPEAIGGLTTPQ